MNIFKLVTIFIFNISAFAIDKYQLDFNDLTLFSYDEESHYTTKLYDLDKDGDQDFIIKTGNSLFWYENIGNLEYSFHKISDEISSAKISILDFDNDGDFDIVSFAGYLYKNNGNQYFEKTNLNELTYDSILVDFDYDNDIDIISYSGNLYENINGSFSKKTIFNKSNIVDLIIYDINKDGLKDIIYLDRNTIGWYENNINKFTEHYIDSYTYDGYNNYPTIKLFDYNKDGNKELFFIYNEFVYYQNIQNTFDNINKIIIDSNTIKYSIIDFVDLDNDSTSEIILSAINSEFITIYEKNSNSFIEKYIPSTNRYVQYIGSFDIDNDNDIDIITYNKFNKSYNLHQNNINKENKKPNISNIIGTIDNNGNLTVHFDPYDYENSSMDANIYLSYVNNTVEYQSLSKKTLLNFSGTSTRTIIYSQNELINLNINNGDSFKIKVNLFDDQNAENIGYSSTIDYSYSEPVQVLSVTSISENINDDGSITINFRPYSELNLSMGADFYISYPNLIDSFNPNTKKTYSPNNFYGNDLRSITYSKSELDNYGITNGKTFKIRLDLFDSNSNSTKAYTLESIYNYNSTNDSNISLKTCSEVEVNSPWQCLKEQSTFSKDDDISAWIEITGLLNGNYNTKFVFTHLDSNIIENYYTSFSWDNDPWYRVYYYLSNKLSGNWKVDIYLDDKKVKETYFNIATDDIPLRINSISNVSPISATKGSEFSFNLQLNSSLPSGYKVIANFNRTDNSNLWLNLSESGAMLELDCNDTHCSKTTIINGVGDRKVRYAILDNNSNIVGEYSNSKNFTVTDSTENQAPIHISTTITPTQIIEAEDINIKTIFNDVDGDFIVNVKARYKNINSSSWTELNLSHLSTESNNEIFTGIISGGLLSGEYELQVQASDKENLTDSDVLHTTDWIEVDGGIVVSIGTKTAILSFVKHNSYDDKGKAYPSYLGMDFKGSSSRNALPFGNDAVIKFKLEDTDNIVSQIQVNCDDKTETEAVVATKETDGFYTATCIYNFDYYSNLKEYDSSLKQIKLNFSAVAVDTEGNEVSNKLTHIDNYFIVYDYVDYQRQQNEIKKQIENLTTELNQKIVEKDNLFNELQNLSSSNISLESNIETDSQEYAENIVEKLQENGVFDLDKNDTCLWINKNGNCSISDDSIAGTDIKKFGYKPEDEIDGYKYKYEVQYAFNNSSTTDNYPAKIKLISLNDDYPVEIDFIEANNSIHLVYQSIILTESFKSYIDENSNVENSYLGSNLKRIIEDTYQKDYEDNFVGGVKFTIDTLKVNLSFLNEVSDDIQNQIATRIISSANSCFTEYSDEIYQTANTSVDNFNVALASDDWAVIGEHYSRAIYQIPLGAFVAISNCTDGAISGAFTDEEKEKLIGAIQNGYNSLDDNLKDKLEQIPEYLQTENEETKAIIELALVKFDSLHSISKKIKITNVGLKPSVSISKSLSNHNLFKKLILTKFSGRNLNRISGRFPQLRIKMDGKFKTKAKEVLNTSDSNTAGTIQEALVNDYFKDVYLKEGYTFIDYGKYGNSGDNGFDGIFIKTSVDNPENVIIIESKPYKSGFTMNPKVTKTPPTPDLPVQFTDEWVDYVIEKLRAEGGDKKKLADALDIAKEAGDIEKIASGIDRAKSLNNKPQLVIMKVE